MSKSPYILVSKINPIRYALFEDYDFIDTYKTDENTLSCNTIDWISHKAKQLWQTNDVITTQIKTSYDLVTAKAISKNREVELSVKQVRDFQNVVDIRDTGIGISGTANKLFLYFKSGNTYNDNFSTKDTYDSYGVKPHFLKKGVKFTLFNSNHNNEKVGDFEVEQILYSEPLNSDVVIFSTLGNTYDDVNQGAKWDRMIYQGGCIVKSIYNIHPYNVWEFDTDFSKFENDDFRIVVNFEDAVLDKKTFISELQSVKKIQENCLELIYFDAENSEFMYETGIINKLRLLVEKQTDTSNTETDIHIGDTKALLLQSSFYEGKDFDFSCLTSEQAKTLELALLHPNVFINRIGYVSKERPKKEQLENTNLYVVTAQLLKSGVTYHFGDKFKQVDVEEIIIDTPNLINNGIGGFISY